MLFRSATPEKGTGITSQAHSAQPLASTPPASFLWLELTGKCELECIHCYAQSGPSGTHRTMTAVDWRSVIGQAAVLGVSMVQFIGGEPTLHPDFPGLLRHAIDAGQAVPVRWPQSPPSIPDTTASACTIPAAGTAPPTGEPAHRLLTASAGRAGRLDQCGNAGPGHWPKPPCTRNRGGGRR